MVSFIFEFDKPDRKYNAGETISCIVKVSVFSKFNARSLSIRFFGFAHTEWTQTSTRTDSNGQTHTVDEEYTGDETFFRDYQYVFGSKNASETEVTPGTHTYNVRFKLPENLPSTFEHMYGHIRYSVKANYDVAWGFDKDGTTSFYVTAKTDLNEFPYLREPVKETEEKIFGCCCCESDPMHLINILPRGGFVPGETIPITIEVDNNSNVRIDYVRVKLTEHLTFITHSPSDTKSESTTINEQVFTTTVAPLQKKRFEARFYLDPNYVYRIFNGCGIITCEYRLKTDAEASGCHSNPDISTKIIIGSIPFNEVISNGNLDPITPAILAPTAPIASINDVIIEQPLPSYDDITNPGPSNGIGWNTGLRSPSGAPIASTEKIDFDNDLAPPSFEDSQKSPIAISAAKNKATEAGETTPSAPSEPTAPPE